MSKLNLPIYRSGQTYTIKKQTICRYCERSEVIQFVFLAYYRSGLLHYVRCANKFLIDQSMILPIHRLTVLGKFSIIAD